MSKITWDSTNSLWIVNNGELIEGTTLGTNVAAMYEGSTGNFHATDFIENENTLDVWGDSIFSTGSFHSGWGTYNQSNISNTIRKYAGKTNEHAFHIYRAPNISSSSTWGGLVVSPPPESKRRGHKYRFSFDYRGYGSGDYLDVYQNFSVGWGSYGIGLPTAWGRSVYIDTDWNWIRYEEDFEIRDDYLDWAPGQNQQTWNAETEYSGGWYGVLFEGYVYRHVSGRVSTVGKTPQQEWDEGTGVYNLRWPSTPGYADIYRQIKIGFSYYTQNTRGTHVFIDNVQLTDITANLRWSYGAEGWKVDNIADEGIHIYAQGTGAVTLDKGDGGDIFAVEGNRKLSVNGTTIYNTSGRGLRLTVINSETGEIIADGDGPRGGQYDTYGDDTHRTLLAERLATMTDSEIWVLTSYDAVNPNTDLDNQMRRMGSVLHVNDGGEYSIFTGGGVRHPYAAVGRGQKLIKEDGANANDAKYKRKGTIDLRV